MSKSVRYKTRGRVSQGAETPLAPDSRGIRIKKRPRGKPFPKGHSIGEATRFRAGQPSANPSGRPRHAEISKALRARLESPLPLPSRGRTGAEELAERWFIEARKGNVAALASLADRAEGRAPISVGINDGNAGLIALVTAVEELHPHLGSPEGFVPLKRLKEADLEGEVVGEYGEEEEDDAE
jgi:hypothetical protein